MRGEDATTKRFSGKAGQSIGTAEMPGFHTAAEIEITYSYAVQKAIPASADTWYSISAPSSDFEWDYPVIVHLNMEGFDKTTDYDIEKTFLPMLREVFNQVDGYDGYMDIVEEGAVDFGTGPSSIAEKMFQEALVSLETVPELEDHEFEWLSEEFLSESLSDKAVRFVMDYVGQYRYLEDVPVSRIVRVDIIVPVWPAWLDSQSEVEEDQAELIEKAGWQVVDRFDDIRLDVVQDAFSSDYIASDIEYHGTSWKNLRAAAPSIAEEVKRHFPKTRMLRL